MKPAVTLIYAQGCPACDEVKPEFAAIAKELPSWQFAMLDLNKPNIDLDFPVEYTPTIHFAFEGRRFTTNPAALNRTLTAPIIRAWLVAAVKKARGATGGAGR